MFELDIKNLFNLIAPKYDFMNNIISFGRHKAVKKISVGKLRLQKQSRVLDLCSGSGDICELFAKNPDVEKVIGVDFSEKMIEVAKSKNASPKIEYFLGDATKLPFVENSFDVVSIAFGLRNIKEIDKCLSEIQRVLKPNGSFMFLDFSKSDTFFDTIFDFIVLFLARLFFKQQEPYQYLIQSRRMFYKKNELKKIFARRNLIEESEFQFAFGIIIEKICVNKKV